MEEQGYKIDENILCDFVREEWERKCGQAITCIGCTIFLSDQVNKGNLNHVMYCITDKMIGDFMA